MSNQNQTDISINITDILPSADIEAVEALASENHNDDNEDQFLEGFTSLPIEKTNRNSRGDKGVASLSVINSLKGNGSRVTFTDTLFNVLGNPQRLQFSINGSTLAIASELPGATETFSFKSADVHILYNKSLVLAIAKAFGLDYTDGTTSYSFRDIEYKSIKNNDGESIPVALVTMKSM